MNNKVLVVAPHPDDETLGCAGTLLRHRRDGDRTFWAIVTDIARYPGPLETLTPKKREMEIEAVTQAYGFEDVFRMPFVPAALDSFAYLDLVRAVGNVIKDLAPQVVYTPFIGDAHTDHRYVTEAVGACSKWFRFPGLKRLMYYETLSETEFSMPGVGQPFTPTVFTDITTFMEKKIQIMSLYESEIGLHPFPRSEETVKAQARVRGARVGCEYAEAFMLVLELQA